MDEKLSKELDILIEMKLQEIWPFSSKTRQIKKEYQAELTAEFEQLKNRCMKEKDRSKFMVCFLVLLQQIINKEMSRANKYIAKCGKDKKCKDSIRKFALQKLENLKEMHAKLLLLYRSRE